jgi:hypothetical protein
MEALTNVQRSHPLAIMVDGNLRGAPRVFSPIRGDAQLSGILTLEEAARIIENGGDR